MSLARVRNINTVRADYKGLAVWRWSRKNLAHVPDQGYQKIKRFLERVGAEENITRIKAPKGFLTRIARKKLDLGTVTETDIRASLKPRSLFRGKVLDLSRLQLAKRGPIRVMRDIIGSWLILKFPRLRKEKYDFCFMVHPRTYSDVLRGVPFLKIMPKSWVRWIVKNLPPFVLSEIIGLRDLNGRSMTGVLMTAAGWDREMFEADREGGEAKITDGVILARRLGIKFVGMAALLPWASRYGKCLEGIPEIQDVTITTGHPLAVVTISNNVRDLLKLHPKQDPLIAVLGAGGSTGSSTSQRLAMDGINNILLVDKVKKAPVYDLDELKLRLEELNPRASVETSVNLEDLRKADIIIVVSSARDVIVNSEHLRPGAIVLDDSQPRNVNPKMAEVRDDILIITVLAGLKGLMPNFVFDRHTPFTDASYTCMIDVALMAMTNTRQSSIGPATMEFVEKAERMVNGLIQKTGENPCKSVFCTYGRNIVPPEEIRRIAALSLQSDK